MEYARALKPSNLAIGISFIILIIRHQQLIVGLDYKRFLHWYTVYNTLMLGKRRRNLTIFKISFKPSSTGCYVVLYLLLTRSALPHVLYNYLLAICSNFWTSSSESSETSSQYSIAQWSCVYSLYSSKGKPLPLRL